MFSKARILSVLFLASLLLMAQSEPDPEFWAVLVELGKVAVALVASGGIVKVVNWLKAALKLEGQAVQFLAAGVSAVVAVLVLIAEAQITPDSFTVNNISFLVLLFWAAAEHHYRMLVSEHGS